VSGEEENEELEPLQPGSHGFTREQVVYHQRERLIAALATVVSERGYVDITVADITAAARVSRRTFYEHFEGKEQCFLAAFDVVVDHLHELISNAIEQVPDWPHKILAGLRATLRFFAAEPALAHLLLVDSLTAGPAVAERYREVIFSFGPLLEPGREHRTSSAPLPEADTVIGSIASVLARSIAVGETAELERLVPDFAEFILMPYLGPEEAARIAAEASPDS
jgi:AcrR family transcriptional regulator